MSGCFRIDGPLTHAAVLVDRTDSFLVYACFHHAVGDGWSINLAMSQLFNEYASGVDAGSNNDVEMPSYLDFVRAEGEYRGSPDWAADREYFVEKYRDVEPALFARSGSVRSRRRRHHTVRVNPETAQRIRDTGRSVFAFTAAALGEYLRRIHRGGDIVLGVPFLNRSSDAELRTVGCMTNMLPLRIPVDTVLSTAELADQINAQVWELQAYGKVDVFDPKMILSPMMSCAFLMVSAFTLRSSNTASITRSQSFSAP